MMRKHSKKQSKQTPNRETAEAYGMEMTSLVPGGGGGGGKLMAIHRKTKRLDFLPIKRAFSYQRTGAGSEGCSKANIAVPFLI